jgi:hypothetical protein
MVMVMVMVHGSWFMAQAASSKQQQQASHELRPAHAHTHSLVGSLEKARQQVQLRASPDFNKPANKQSIQFTLSLPASTQTNLFSSLHFITIFPVPPPHCAQSPLSRLSLT